MKHAHITRLSIGTAVAAAIVIVPDVSARAHEGHAPHAHTRTGQQAQAEARAARENARVRVDAKMAEVKQRLDEKRAEMCERREKNINSITDRSVGRANKHLAVFQKIEERVKTYYQDKNLGAADYEMLAAEADAKEAAVIAAVEATAAVELDCSTEGTQRQVGTYMKELVHEHQVALKNYRTAVKELIYVVTQAQKQRGEEGAATQRDASHTEAVRNSSGRQEGAQ